MELRKINKELSKDSSSFHTLYKKIKEKANERIYNEMKKITLIKMIFMFLAVFWRLLYRVA